MKGIRIFVVDDQELVRTGVRSMLEQEADIEVVGDYSSAEEALFLAEVFSPDIILMDAKMADMDGIKATQLLHQKKVPSNVIMLTLDEDSLTEALEAGVAGYLLQNIEAQKLVQAIRKVYHGELVVDERLSALIQPVEGDDSEDSIKEAELIIPLPVSATRLASFTRQVEEVLGATIVQQVGSWDKGTTITVLLPGTMPLAGISERLREMPDVEDAREKPVAKNVLSSFARRGGAMPETHLRGQFVVTLKEDITVKRAESAGRGRKKKALVKVI